MRTHDGPGDLPERIGRIPIIEEDGAAWYRLMDVCEALRIPRERASPAVPAGHKRMRCEFQAGYRSRRVALIDAAGVEAIAIRYARAPTREILRRLPRAPDAEPAKRQGQ